MLTPLELANKLNIYKHHCYKCHAEDIVFHKDFTTVGLTTHQNCQCTKFSIIQNSIRWSQIPLCVIIAVISFLRLCLPS